MAQPTRTQSQLGAFIRRTRKTASLTQSQLAELINKRQATISNLESAGAGANLDTLFAVLSALDLELILRPRSKANIEELRDIF